MYMVIWVLVCVTKEFGADACETFTFTNEKNAIAARDSADINCNGWHSLHSHTIDVGGDYN